MKRKAKRINKSVARPAKIVAGMRNEEGDGLGVTMPPSLVNVEIYFDQKGLFEAAMDFFTAYQQNGWKSTYGRPIRNWKACAAEWIFNYRQVIELRRRRSRFYSGSFG